MRRLLCCIAAIAIALPLCAGEPKPKPAAYLTPEEGGVDYTLQGEYTGELERGGAKAKAGLQIIALGNSTFRAVLHNGGLPGDGYDKSPKEEIEGQLADGTLSFKHANWSASVKDGSAAFSAADGKALGALKRVVRESPTLGAKPPEGAVVLFDGKNLDQWQKGARMTPEGLLMEGANSVPKYQSVTLHVEFMLPFMPAARGQGRGNSGVYLQGRYESQVLDSFGLAGKNNETGGIYEIKDPALNMCFPPLQWQTYDIEFTAAKWVDGKKTENARITSKVNGVVVQDNTELPRGTRAAPVAEGPEPSFLHLQNHGNPVRYRNIWYVEKK